MIFDQGGRATVFDMDFRLVRTAQLPSLRNLGPRWSSIRVLRWPDAVLINALVPEAPGRSFHLADVSSERPVLVKSFGGDDPPGLSLLARLTAPPVAGKFWAADRVWYRLQQWDLEGNWIDGFRRTASWFPDYVSGQAIFGRDSRPVSQIEAVAQEGQGRLWVFMVVASPNWKQLVERACPEPGFCAPFEGLYTYELEVIDAARGLSPMSWASSSGRGSTGSA